MCCREPEAFEAFERELREKDSVAIVGVIGDIGQPLIDLLKYKDSYVVAPDWSSNNPTGGECGSSVHLQY